MGAARRRHPPRRLQVEGLSRRRNHHPRQRQQAPFRIQRHSERSQQRRASPRRSHPPHRSRPQAAPIGNRPHRQNPHRISPPVPNREPSHANPHGPQTPKRQLPRPPSARQSRPRIHTDRESRLGSRHAKRTQRRLTFHRDSPGKRQHSDQLHPRRHGDRGGQGWENRLATHQRRSARASSARSLRRPAPPQR